MSPSPSPDVEKRKRPPAKKLHRSTPASVPRLPAPDPEFVEKATTFWGTVYGLSGEKVGKAFIADDGDDRIVLARMMEDAGSTSVAATTTTMTTTTTMPCRSEKRKSRVFIGKVQEFWGIDVRAVRDLEPVPPLTRMGRLNPFAVRFYVGNKAMLRRRRKAATVSSPVLERESSPAWSLGSDLTELSDDEGNVQDLPPGVVILGEADVARAIEAAVGALCPGPSSGS